MSRKYTYQALLTCLILFATIIVVAVIFDLLLAAKGQIVLCVFLVCAGCLPLWLIFNDMLTKYYEQVDKKHKCRKMIRVVHTKPTKSMPWTNTVTDTARTDLDIKIYRTRQGTLEVRQIIPCSDLESDTQIYSIKK